MKHTFPRNNYIVFDFETTGLDHRKEDVIQLAAIKRIDGVWTAPFNRFVNIGRPLPELIINLTGITDEMLSTDGVSADVAWKEFQEYISNLPLIGHNIVSFDRLFLERFFTEHELELPITKRYVDTAMLYKAHKLELMPFWHENHYEFASRVGKVFAKGIYYKLTGLCDELGIDISQFDAHRADSDIQMTNLIYEYFIENL